MAANAALLDLGELQQQARDTQRKLEALWDEMGTEAAVRNEALLHLRTELANAFAAACKKEQANRDALQQGILRLLTELAEVNRALGTDLQVEEELGQLPLLERHSTLLHRLQQYETKLKERTEQVQSLQAELRALWSELASDRNAPLAAALLTCSAAEPSLDDSEQRDLSSARVGLFKDYIVAAKAEKNARVLHMKSLTADLLDLWAVLDMPLESAWDQRIVREEPLPPTLEMIAQMEERKAQLQEERQARETEVKEYASKISALWRQLQVPEAEQEAFFARHAGLGPAVLAACKGELQRLQERKAASMKDLIAAARRELDDLRDELRMSAGERAEFAALAAGAPSEEVLQAHTAEIERLQLRLEHYRPLLGLINRRETLRQERHELDVAAADPSRLLSKNRHMAQQLLHEEKLRKQIAKELPAVEARLKTGLADWENRYQQPFLWDGKRYLDMLDDEEVAARRKKEDEKARRDEKKQRAAVPAVARENLAPPVARTPAPSRLSGSSSVAAAPMPAKSCGGASKATVAPLLETPQPIRHVVSQRTPAPTPCGPAATPSSLAPPTDHKLV